MCVFSSSEHFSHCLIKEEFYWFEALAKRNDLLSSQRLPYKVCVTFFFPFQKFFVSSLISSALKFHDDISWSGLLWWLSGKESTCQCKRWKRHGFHPRVGKSPRGGNANHSTILAWEIPWTEEPVGLQSIGSQKSQTQVRRLSTHTCLGCLHLLCQTINGAFNLRNYGLWGENATFSLYFFDNFVSLCLFCFVFSEFIVFRYGVSWTRVLTLKSFLLWFLFWLIFKNLKQIQTWRKVSDTLRTFFHKSFES